MPARRLARRASFFTTAADDTAMPHESDELDNEQAALVATNSSSGAGTRSDLARVVDTASARQLADDQLVILHEVAKSLAQDRSLQATLSLIADKACFLTSSASTALCLLDEERQALDFAAVAGRGAAEMLGQRVRVEDALPGQTALSGEPLLAYNPVGAQEQAARGKASPESDDQSKQPDGSEQAALRGGVRSAAVVPIVIGSSSVGSLAAINRLDGQSFTGSDLLMLQILAASASAAIQKDFLSRQAAQRERERNILFRVAQNTSSSLDVQKILDGTLDILSLSVDLSAAMVFLLNDERTHLYIASQIGLTPEQQEMQILADGRLASAALSGGGKALIVDEPLLDPSYDELLTPSFGPVQSMMAVPLAAREGPAGLIVTLSRQRLAYTREDLTLLAAVATQTAVAVENAWLYEDATRRAEEATAIYELSQTVNTDLNLGRVLSFVADSILALLQVDKFALFLYNPKRACLEIKVARNISRETVRTMCPNAERRGIAWWVYEYETPTAVQDVPADHRNRSLPLDAEGVASLVSVPLQAGDRVIGVMHAMSSRRRAFTVGEMEMFYTIANQVGIAISNIQTLEETRRASAELRRSFRRTVRALGASADTSQTAQAIVDLAAEMMDADSAVLYNIDPDREGGQPLLRAFHGLRLPAAAIGTAASASGAREPSAAWVARRGRPLAIGRPAQDTRFAPSALLAPYVSRSGFYLGVPLKIGDRVVGVLEIYKREAKTIPADEMRRYLTFAAQSAVALENAVLAESAARRKNDVEIVARTTRALRSAPAIDSTVLTGCLEQVIAAVGADWALLVGSSKLGIKRKGLLVGRGVEAGEPQSGGDQSLRDALRLVVDAMRERGTGELAWPGLTNSPEPWPVKEIDARPVAAFSIMERGSSGALCVARRPGRAPFTTEDQRLVQTVAKLIGIFA